MAIGKENIEDLYPLAPMQEGVLFHTLYTPASGAYLDQMNFALHGELDFEAFAVAWQRVVDRHPALRPVFVWENRDTPLQVVLKNVPLTVARHDWRAYDATEQQQRLQNFLAEDRGRGFKLSEAPLMRLTLVQLAEQEYRFIWTYHHLLFDGWSLPLLLKEFLSFYEARRRGENLQLAPPRPYRDYIAWLKRQNLAEAEKFWRAKLKGFAAPSSFGVTGALHDNRADAELYDQVEIKLSPASTEALQNFARQHRLTLNTVVQGAWALLLSRYGGEDDVVFGTIVSGRPAELEGVESMIGVFINTLPMRVAVKPHEKLGTWLQALQGEQFDLRQYEYSPLAQVQTWSEAPRGAPLFESILVFSNYPMEVSFLDEIGSSLKLSGLRAVERTHYPLSVFGVPGKQLALWIDYDASRFERATVRRMLGHLQTLLESMVTQPNARLADLSMLAAAERKQLLFDWNETQADYPRAQCFPQLFAAQVAATPDAIAVVFEEEHMSYAELHRRAGELATHLQTFGVGPEVLVGVCMERSAEMMIALLAVMKAGGAYVPLDPAFPKERLQFMLHDAQVKVLIVDRESWLVDGGSWVVVDSRSWMVASETSVTANDPRSTIHDQRSTSLAYVIYTSGSTGKPKGVMISHRALVNFLTAMQRAPGLCASDVLLAVTTLSFDIAGLELYLPLLAGGRVDIANRETARDAVKLLERLKTSGATVMQATPATWRMLLEVGWQGDPQLKILAGGEALPRELVEGLHDKCASLWNMYGPTETTIWSTTELLQKDEHVISIGRPIANTTIYILDAQLQPAPIGVAGDLYIGGAGVARGYLKRADLTAEKFVPNPFVPHAVIQQESFYALGTAPNSRDESARVKTLEVSLRAERSNLQVQFPRARGLLRSARNDVFTQDESSGMTSLLSAHSNDSAVLYKTGDRARYLPNGKIEFLGRDDFQIKLRGFRIELGDIEFALAQHPSVQQAVAHVREDAPGDQRLVAYIVARPAGSDQSSVVSRQYSVNSDEQPATSDEHPATGNQLRIFLRDKLPEYMIPSAFVFLNEMPLTPNGKVNRKALPAPERTHAASEASYVAPRTEIERTLAAIWKEVLRVEQVGLHDNFFDLGGHSILAIQIISRLRGACKVELSLHTLFESPTVMGLAEQVEKLRRPQGHEEKVAKLLQMIEAASNEEVQALLSEN